MHELTFTEISRQLNLSPALVHIAYKSGMRKLKVAIEEKGLTLEEMLLD